MLKSHEEKIILSPWEYLNKYLFYATKIYFSSCGSIGKMMMKSMILEWEKIYFQSRLLYKLEKFKNTSIFLFRVKEFISYNFEKHA